MASRPLAARVAALPLRWMGIGAGVLALGVSGLAGGLDPVTAPGLPQVRPSELSPGGPWNVTVLTGRLIADLSPIRPDHDGDRWFIVLAKVENTDTESRNDAISALSVSNVDGLVTKTPSHLLLSRDGSEVNYLNPGMPEVVGYVWEQRADAKVPTSVDVVIWGYTHRISSLNGHLEWLDRAERATVHAPVQDRRA